METPCPAINYQNLAMAIVRVAAEDFVRAKKFIEVTYPAKKQSLESKKKNRRTQAMLKKLECDRTQAEKEMLVSESFFLSEKFDIFMPSVNGEDFLRGLEKLRDVTMRDDS